MNIGSVTVSTPYMNGACSVAKTPEDIDLLCATSVGVVTIGSITVEPRDGNTSPRWYDNQDFALNSFGMPNEGLEYYRAELPNMVSTIHSSGKVTSLSVAGFSVAEYVKLAKLATQSKVDLLELNLGCPNVSQDGKQKPIASFDIAYMKQIIDEVHHVTSLPLMVKLSPYSDPTQLLNVAQFIKESGKVSAVVTSNTFANGYYETNHQPVLGSTYGGVSGPALLPITLGQVRQFRQALPDEIAVIGVGGIASRADMELYLSAGATAVQVATLIVRSGHNAIDRLAA